jgi:hypothetical protein
MDVYGKVLVTKSFSEITSLDVEILPPGVYILIFKHNGAIRGMTKMVKD